MMNSDNKTLLPSLIDNIKSDLFTLENISKSTTLAVSNVTADSSISNEDVVEILSKWDVVVSLLPLKFIDFIENYPDIYTVEPFDKKYTHNPKLCAYDKYGTTNMWRPLMCLNKCPSITRFDFEYIRYYNITVFSKILSVLIARDN